MKGAGSEASLKDESFVNIYRDQLRHQVELQVAREQQLYESNQGAAVFGGGPWADY